MYLDSGLDLFAYGASEPDSPERLYLLGLADAAFKPRPTEPIWRWAEREVWLGGKQAAVPKQYDSKLTPWTREWQELPMRDDVRVGCALKSSRTGFTEGSFNILRWMPENWPGNVLYAINSQALARQIVDRRIIPTLAETAAAHLSSDVKDNTLSRISMPHMDLVFSGSGASGPFMEMWYRLIILDELENHETDQETTTFQRAQSRQTDVPDGLILAISKPERAGGPIDELFIRGSQKRYLVPCPRCERRIELLTNFLVADHCRDGASWDLARVVSETYYQCQLCHQPIDEKKEKEAMVDAGIWVARPPEERRRPESGRYVPPEPGYESYHISDNYSLHERATWGEMKRMQLMAHEIAPSEHAKKYFRVNHEGWPWEDVAYSITDESIRALKSGRIEEIKETAADGTTQIIRRILAHPALVSPAPGDITGAPRSGKYYHAYLHGKMQAPLPFRPAWITLTVDKQFTFLKYQVFAWLPDGNAFLIDRGSVQDEDQLEKTLRLRPYYSEGHLDPLFITAGLMDASHRPHEVYRFCLKMWRLYQWRIWPAKGEGNHEDYKGKIFRKVKDWVDGTAITVRFFYDHGLKNEFYLQQIQKRVEPRLWLPEDLNETTVAEWTAEKYDEKEKAWVHNASKFGPNDEGDTGKMQYVIFHEGRDALARLGEALPEEAPENQPVDTPAEE